MRSQINCFSTDRLVLAKSEEVDRREPNPLFLERQGADQVLASITMLTINHRITIEGG
jgi:hypothetical protein